MATRYDPSMAGPADRGRRQFPAGPSQIAGLPGNFAVPSASPHHPPPRPDSLRHFPDSPSEAPYESRAMTRVNTALTSCLPSPLSRAGPPDNIPPPPGAGGGERRPEPPSLLLTGEVPPPPRNIPPPRAAAPPMPGPPPPGMGMGPGPQLGRFNPGGGFKPDLDAMRLPRVGAPLRGPGTPPQGDDSFGVDDFPPSRPSQPPSRGGPGPGRGPRRLGTPNDVRELEDRLVAAESAAAAHASRLRNMERRMAIAEAARKEDSGGARGVIEALEQRVSNLQMENARAGGLVMELKGRLDATESDVKESRAQAMRVEAVSLF